MKICTFVILTVIAKFAIATEDCFDHGVDYVGFDLEDGVYVSTGSAEACQISCQQKAGCNYWTWDPTYHSACWRKYAKGAIKYDPALTSGPRTCGQDTTPAPPDPAYVRVMSYNLFGWNALHNPEKTENIYETVRAFNPDILGVQEDEGMNIQIAENIGYGNDYR